MSLTDQERIEMSADNCEVLRARLAKYEDAEGNPISTIAEQAREIERLRLNIAEYNEHERCYQSEIAALKADYTEACADAMEVARELAALKAQPVGVVLPEPLKAAIMRADDVLHALAGWESSSVKLEQRHGADWLKEIDAIRRELHTQLARLNSSPVSAGDDAQYPPCDYCAEPLSYHPWHGSGLINGVESRHIHACDKCRHLLPAVSAVGVDERAAVQSDILCDCAYRNGLIAGFGFGINDDEAGYQRSLACYQGEIHEARAALSAPSHGEQVPNKLPGGWTAKPTDDGEGFIISSPRINGVASHFSVFPDSKDYASHALWKMLAAAPSAGSHGGDV